MTRTLLPLLLGAVIAAAPAHAARTVDTRWYSFFDAPLVEDAWAQRAEVGFVQVRSFTHPVTHESTFVDGPRLVPGMGATTTLYAPARMSVTARDLPELTIDTIGGTRSPAPMPMGLLPYDLMGGLGTPPVGGNAHLQATMQFITRARANALSIPQQFGYHGWENEAVLTLTMDRAGARKVLGLSNAQVDGFAAWFAANEEDLEQAWWWWLNDEGGDVHVGGLGRLDVRFAFNTPMQMWRVDVTQASYDVGTDQVTLVLDWVAMASDILWSRWIREALQSPFESSAMSDMTLDVRIGPTDSDLDLDCVEDYALTQTGGQTKWTFEPSLADVPNLAVEYLNESLWETPGLPYADKRYKRKSPGYEYVPTAWNLRAGETLTLDIDDVAAKGQMEMALRYQEPAGTTFPGQIDVGPTHVTFTGPMDMAAASQAAQPRAWMRLADAAHPEGLLPWGLPYVTFKVLPGFAARPLFKKPKRPARVGRVDTERTVPPFPTAALDPTPPLAPGPGGRSVRFDFYNLFDVTMVADRWAQYDENDYVRVDSLTFPVRYRSTDYFGVEDPEPFSLTASGMRLKVTARALPEITIDTVGAGAQGFLPRDLMGGLDTGVVGGTATFAGHMQYGTRAREAIYRLPEYWGYYGWENFLDARLTLDRAAARKIVGISDADAGAFATWWASHEEDFETAWRLWLYEEWKRTNPMPWFNYPIQIWACDFTLVEADASHVVLDMTILNEALDVVLGRWMHETFMPHSEHSWDDMHLRWTIGPTSSDVDVDTVLDWSLYADDSLPGSTTWSWEPFFGDNPFLAHEYRAVSSPALPYFGMLTPDGVPYTETPTIWDLQAGEQINFHFRSAGLTLDETEPDASEFPSQITADPDATVSFTGPLDLTTWSMSAHPAEWAATGGLVPRGFPTVTLAEDP